MRIYSRLKRLFCFSPQWLWVFPALVMKGRSVFTLSNPRAVSEMNDSLSECNLTRLLVEENKMLLPLLLP